MLPFDGDIDDYRKLMLGDRPAKPPKSAKPATPTEPPTPKPTATERRQKLAPLRQEAAKVERLIQRIQGAMAETGREAGRPQELHEGARTWRRLGRKKAEYVDGLEKAEGKWLEMLEEIEGIEQG